MGSPLSLRKPRGERLKHWRAWILDPKILFIGGTLLGIGLGLVLGWLVWPVSYFDTDYFDLRADYRDDFVVMVGALDALQQDVGTSRELLALLSDPNTPRSIESIIVDVTERYIARGANPVDIHHLVNLAEALGAVTTPMQPYLIEQQP
jgi:hypothetical protein